MSEKKGDTSLWFKQMPLYYINQMIRDYTILSTHA